MGRVRTVAGGYGWHPRPPAGDIRCIERVDVGGAGTRPAPDERCNQRTTEVIRGHQRRSEAIRGHQRPSEAIRFGAWPAPIADDHVVAHGGVGVTDAPDEGAHQRPLEVIRVHQVGVTDARSPGFARREGERHQSPSDAISRNQCNGRTFARAREARRRLGR